MEHKFNYVIGRPWDDKDPDQLAIYVLHNSEIQYGTPSEADRVLEYVKRMSPNQNWSIYQVTYNKIS